MANRNSFFVAGFKIQSKARSSDNSAPDHLFRPVPFRLRLLPVLSAARRECRVAPKLVQDSAFPPPNLAC